jgi:hypothetical protein
MKKIGRSVGTIAAALIFSGVILAAPASADAWSGVVYELTTGAYYPQWWANNCLDAGVTNGTHYNDGVNYTYVEDGTNCSGIPGNMPAGFLEVQVAGYRDGSYCGETGYYTNSSSTSSLGVYSPALCSNPGGTHVYHTFVDALTESLINGSYQYVYVGGLASPNQN